jgi:hypothetical protein
MARYLACIRKQLQDVSDLFTARYGNNSNIAEIAVKALVSSALLEHEVYLLEHADERLMQENLTEVKRSMGAAR